LGRYGQFNDSDRNVWRQSEVQRLSAADYGKQEEEAGVAPDGLHCAKPNDQGNRRAALTLAK
jgi:hypothetical protein